jgi:hypothetical protein
MMRNANRTILSCLSILILGWLLPLKMNSDAVEEVLFGLVLIVLCIAICWKLLRIMELRGTNVVIRVLLTLFLAFVLVCITGIFWLGKSMCGYSSERVLYQNKEIPNLHIIERSYGCGAYDSQTPLFETYKVRPLGTWISYVSKTDTATLNKNEWVPVFSK